MDLDSVSPVLEALGMSSAAEERFDEEAVAALAAELDRSPEQIDMICSSIDAGLALVPPTRGGPAAAAAQGRTPVPRAPRTSSGSSRTRSTTCMPAARCSTPERAWRTSSVARCSTVTPSTTRRTRAARVLLSGRRRTGDQPLRRLRRADGPPLRPGAGRLRGRRGRRGRAARAGGRLARHGSPPRARSPRRRPGTRPPSCRGSSSSSRTTTCWGSST